jgi:hypothetical protein
MVQSKGFDEALETATWASSPGAQTNANDKSRAVGCGVENPEARKTGCIGNIASVFAGAHPGSGR